MAIIELFRDFYIRTIPIKFSASSYKCAIVFAADTHTSILGTLKDYFINKFFIPSWDKSYSIVGVRLPMFSKLILNGTIAVCIRNCEWLVRKMNQH